MLDRALHAYRAERPAFPADELLLFLYSEAAGAAKLRAGEDSQGPRVGPPPRPKAPAGERDMFE